MSEQSTKILLKKKKEYWKSSPDVKKSSTTRMKDSFQKGKIQILRASIKSQSIKNQKVVRFINSNTKLKDSETLHLKFWRNMISA